MTRDELDARHAAIKEFLADMHGPDVVVLEGPEFDDGIVGVTQDGRVAYSYGRLVDALMQSHGWDETDAVDWIEFDTLRSLPYLGDRAPVVLTDIDLADFAPDEKIRKKPLDPEHGDVVQYGAKA